jgi:hypothetical protein
LLRIEIESILRGSFVSLASKGYPSRDGVWRRFGTKWAILYRIAAIPLEVRGIDEATISRRSPT